MVRSRPAGRRFPHATSSAREADHSFCPVLETVRQRVERGLEQWGTLHNMPAVAREAEARDAKNGLYRAARHTGRARGRCGEGEPLSVQAGYDRTAGGFAIWFRVFTRAQARAEIVRRVNSGESLAYNVMRRQ